MRYDDAYSETPPRLRPVKRLRMMLGECLIALAIAVIPDHTKREELASFLRRVWLEEWDEPPKVL